MRKRPPWNASPLAVLGIKAGFRTALERATAIGCSRSHLLHCESGATVPGLDLIARIAASYNVTDDAVIAAVRQVYKRRGAK